jgi:hypothetical protein
MNLNEISGRNYAANVRRGQIKKSIRVSDFIDKTKEELQELEDSVGVSHIHPFDPKEAVDILLVQTALLHHFGYDVEKLVIEKMLFNETRPD